MIILKDIKKATGFLVVIALLLVCSITFAAVFAFYIDDSRIQLESAFKYTYVTSNPNIGVENDVNFTFPSGTTNRSYTITFTVDASGDQNIYFTVYYANKSSSITSISGGARGYVTMGSTPTCKTLYFQPLSRPIFLNRLTHFQKSCVLLQQYCLQFYKIFNTIII